MTTIKIISLEDTGLVLQKIYSSEINLKLTPFWDAGWDAHVGNDMSGWEPIKLIGYDATKINEVVSVAASFICEQYPDSAFKSWFSEFVSEKPSLEACARPLIEYLNDNHHPHCKVIVTTDNAEVVEGVKTTGLIEDYIKD